jgi:type I restriction enzyme S subunit
MSNTNTQTIPDGWRETTLGDECDIFTGRKDVNQTNPSGEYAFFSCSPELFRSDDFLFDGKALIVVGNGSYTGTVRFFDGKFDLYQRTYACTAKEDSELDLKFAFYYAKRFFEQKYMGGSRGSSIPYIVRGDLEDFEIPQPSLPEQKAIADVLSSFDDKIELLRDQNKTLEAMAQVLFKHWFVDFEFPNVDGKPYKSSGGKMVDSELGEMPDGWKAYHLDELLNIVNGYSYKGSELRTEAEDALVTLKSFDRNGGFQTRGFKPFDGSPKTEQEVRVGDLVVAHTDLTQDADVLGNPAFIFEDGGYQKMYITMDLVKVVSKNENLDLSFFYFLMQTQTFKAHSVGYATGTTVLHMSKRAIPEYPIALPEHLGIVAVFSKLTTTITNKISKNVSQIQTLAKTRDTLLPKLMRGEVRVNM